MNVLEKLKNGFESVFQTDVASVEAWRKPSRGDRVEELGQTGKVASDPGDGRSVDVVDKFKQAFRRYLPGKLTREDALACPAYKRAVDLLSNAAAGIICQAKPEMASKEKIWDGLGMRGFSGMDNKFNFWQDAIGNMLIDSYFGEIKGGVLSTDKRRVKIISRPVDVVIPKLVGSDQNQIEFELTTGYNTWGQKETRTLKWDEMVYLRRGNTRQRYKLASSGYGEGTYTDQIKPDPSYQDLAKHIQKLLYLDEYERNYWASPVAWKIGLLLLTSDSQIGQADNYASDLEMLKELAAHIELKSPIKVGSRGFAQPGQTSSIGIEAEAINVFKDYDKSLHALREDAETVIASYFGLNPSDLGSDAARSGTGASELSESSWRNGVLPVIQTCKYEIENKLLGGQVLNISFMEYFQSPQTMGKVSQSCVGAMTVNEYRRTVHGMPPAADEAFGESIYMGSQFSVDGANDSPNEDGLNMRLVKSA